MSNHLVQRIKLAYQTARSTERGVPLHIKPHGSTERVAPLGKNYQSVTNRLPIGACHTMGAISRPHVQIGNRLADGRFRLVTDVQYHAQYNRAR